GSGAPSGVRRGVSCLPVPKTWGDVARILRGATGFEPDEPRVRGPKPTSHVEIPEGRVEVDMEPFHAALAGQVFRVPHEIPAESATPPIRMNGGVQEECVDTTVPGDVHETDEASRVVGTDIPKTSLQDGVEVATGVPRPGGAEKLVQRLVRHRRVDAIVDTG